jgi:pimeloyl-ACP methyl ester carboxylesterase
VDSGQPTCEVAARRLPNDAFQFSAFTDPAAKFGLSACSLSRRYVTPSTAVRAQQYGTVDCGLRSGDAVLDAEQVDRALVWGFSMGARNAASLAVMEPTRVAALVCGGGGPLPGSDGRRERVLAFADLVKTVDGMTTWLRSIGTPDEAVAESLARNDSAAVSATMAGAAEWIPAADEVRAPSLWYMGSDDEGGFTAEELELATRLRVETHLLPRADHVASFRRASDVLSIVRPFLDQHRVMT